MVVKQLQYCSRLSRMDKVGAWGAWSGIVGVGNSTVRGRKHRGYLRLHGRLVGVGDQTLILGDTPEGRYWLKSYSHLLFLDDRREREIRLENVVVSGWLDMHLVEQDVAGLFLFDMRHGPRHLARPLYFLMGMENRAGRVHQDCLVIAQAYRSDAATNRLAGMGMMLAGFTLAWLVIPIILIYWGYRRMFARDIAEISEAMRATIDRHEGMIASLESRRRSGGSWGGVK